MPNHITNLLTIKHHRPELFRDNNKNGTHLLSFAQSVPPPPDIEPTMSILSKESEWFCEHWGTKWDCYDVEFVQPDENTLVYKFLTAWTAPEYWLKRVSELYTHGKFDLKWCDEDYWECGHFYSERGKIKQIEYYNNDDPSTEKPAVEFLRQYFPQELAKQSE